MVPDDATTLRGEAPLLDETLNVLSDLIGFPTVTSASNLGLIDYAEARLRAVGADVVRTYDAERRKANLFATIGPAVDGGVVLSGHTDVVPAHADDWTTPPFVADHRDGRVYGRGTSDMKGFIACALAMAPRFAAVDLARPVHLALTFDEEVGCHGAPLMIAALARTGPRPLAAIVGEPTMLGIVAGHKGCHEYTTTITGVPGHGSTPARSVNAIEYAARYVSRLLELREDLRRRAPGDSPYDPPESTVSVGVIRGGTARNVVPATCSFDWELRPIDAADADHARAVAAAIEAELSAQMRADFPEAGIVTTSDGEVGGLDVDEGSAAVRLVRRLRGGGDLHVASYNTEAGLFQKAGIPAVLCGPGSIDVAHRPDEYVGLDQLEGCLRMLEGLTAELSGRPHA